MRGEFADLATSASPRSGSADESRFMSARLSAMRALTKAESSAQRSAFCSASSRMPRAASSANSSPYGFVIRTAQ